MRLVNHILEGATYDPAKTIGGVIDPKFLVMHYTAGYTMESARQVFKTTDIAAHITIDKDGRVLQMAPLNRRLNHAGPSAHQGIQFLNNHSIGIEHVNIGWAKMRADGRLVDAYNNLIDPEKAKSWIEAPNARVGSGRIFWEPYTEAQILASIEVTKAILGAYNIRDIVSHEEIDTRGWKTDPGPAFPMNRFTSLMRGTPSQMKDQPAVAGLVGTVTTASLNIRGGAGTNFPPIGALKAGQRVAIVGQKDGWFQIKVKVGGQDGTGWVLDDYVKVD